MKEDTRAIDPVTLRQVWELKGFQTLANFLVWAKEVGIKVENVEMPTVSNFRVTCVKQAKTAQDVINFYGGWS